MILAAGIVIGYLGCIQVRYCRLPGPFYKLKYVEKKVPNDIMTYYLKKTWYFILVYFAQ